MEGLEMSFKRMILCGMMLGLLILPCMASASSTGSVKGQLHKNSASGAALSGAKVTCGGESDKTDDNGKFKIKGIKAGDHTISFSKSGYESYEKTVKIVAGQTANMGDRWLTETMKGNCCQCTDYLNKKLGLGCSGNARTWGPCLKSKGYKEVWPPKQGDISVSQGPTQFGHVAIVDSVDKNNRARLKGAQQGRTCDGKTVFYTPCPESSDAGCDNISTCMTVTSTSAGGTIFYRK